MFPQLAQYTDLSLLLLRLMIAVVFVTSGWRHVTDPRSKYRSDSRVYDVYRRRRGSRWSGSRVWSTHTTRSDWSNSDHVGSDPQEDLCLARRLLGEKASGWHYDLMLVLMNLVVACTNGGKYVIRK